MSPHPLEARPGSSVSSDVPRAGVMAALVLFAAGAAVYGTTVGSSVPAGDSGELISAAWTLGVAHPPGYPLYTLLGYLWSHALPFGPVALRMNLLSLLLHLGAALTVAHIVRRLTASSVAALAAGAFLLFSAPFWKYALVAEVFALNSLLAALVVLQFVDVLEDGGFLPGVPARPRFRLRPLLLLAFLSTLFLAHHHTLILLLAPVDAAVLVALLRARRHGVAAPRIGTVLAGAAIGLLPLLYLPWAASRHPVLNWGDPTTWSAFFRLLTRAEYGTFRLDPSEGGFVADRSHVALFLKSIPHDFTWTGVLLIAIGAVFMVRRLRAPAWPILGFLALQLLFFTRVNFPTEPAVFLGVVERFYILPAVVLAIVLGVGAAGLLRLAASPLAGPMQPLSLVVARALLLLAAAWPAMAHFRLVDQRGNTFTADLTRDVLLSTPENGVLFTQGDLFHNGLAWAQLVEGARPDVVALEEELLTRAWYVREVRRREPDLLPAFGRADRYDGTPETGTRAWIDHFAGRRPAAFLGLKDTTFEPRYEMTGRGFVLVGHPAGTAPSLRAQAAEALDLAASMRLDAYFRAYDPRSFEAESRWRLAEFVSRSAILLCRPECFDFSPDEDPGFGVLLYFIERNRRIGRAPLPTDLPPPKSRWPVLRAGTEPPPMDPEVLRAGAFLRAIHPAVRDEAKARADLKRYLKLVPRGPEADVARQVLESLGP